MIERIMPAYPLFVKDPNYSIWSMDESLNSGKIANWYGELKKIFGFIRVNGEAYCFLGDSEFFRSAGVKPAKQVSLNVTAYTTDYEFEAGEAKLKLSFVSPLPLDDLSLLSMPVCYVNYRVSGVESAEVSFFVNRNIAYNDVPANTNKHVKGGVIKFRGIETAVVGLSRQMILSVSADEIGADWGYWYLSGESSYFTDEKAISAYLASGNRIFECNSEDAYMGCVANAKSGIVMLGYDDRISIDYFGDYRKGYYLENNSILDALAYVKANSRFIDKNLADYDKQLKESVKYLGRKGAKSYYDILVASLRQSIGAHKLITDTEGNILFLSKECQSNGCIGTVDVSYPSMPLYLLENTELVKGMMRPIFKFANMSVWPFDFAPHDVGTYPLCLGQVYGLKNKSDNFDLSFDSNKTSLRTNMPNYFMSGNLDMYDFNCQMPVEESANILIMMYACYLKDRDISMFKAEKTLLDKWVNYLTEYGLYPENQLCTDDFAGHLKNNINLAIKATCGIACYSRLCDVIGEKRAGKKYMTIAKDFANKIIEFGAKYDHIPLTWDSDESTFSLKYNMAMDKILGLGLFPQEILEREVDHYISKANEYGVPLDNRAEYTKSDWLMWSAALSDDIEKQKTLVAILDVFLKKSVNRVPFGDWYETVSGKTVFFKNRTVQGGCFILLMNKKEQ